MGLVDFGAAVLFGEDFIAWGIVFRVGFVDVGDKLSVGGTIEPVEITTLGTFGVESGGILKFNSAWGSRSWETNALTIRPITKANGPRRVTHLPRSAFSCNVKGRKIFGLGGSCIFTSSPHLSSTLDEISGVL